MTHIIEHLRSRNQPAPREQQLTEVLRRVEAAIVEPPKEYTPKPRSAVDEHEPPREITVEEKLAKLEDMTRVLADLKAERAALAEEIDADFARLNELKTRLTNGYEEPKLEEHKADGA